ncbi:MAG: helix-turn-helix domain-containing protein [Anaerovoracaceae bacterium]
MSDFAKNLKYLRKKNDMTQTELASDLGVSRSTIGMYENGEREPDIKTLEAIAAFFNVDMNFLLGGKISASELETKYYMDDEVAELAQEIYDDPDKRILFSAARDISKDDMQFVINMIKRFKGDD